MLGERGRMGREHGEKLVRWLAASRASMIAQYFVLLHSRTPRSGVRPATILEYGRQKRMERHVRAYRQYGDRGSALPRPGHLRCSVSRLGKNARTSLRAHEDTQRQLRGEQGDAECALTLSPSACHVPGYVEV
jgi:hypothetical protein